MEIEKMKRFLMLIIVAAGFVCMAGKVKASAELNHTFEIEQVQAEMPEVSVYLRSSEAIGKEELGVYLDDEKLKISNVEQFKESGEASVYFVLIDISGSIPDAYFAAQKEALKHMADELGQNTMVLMTFGESVEVVFQGGVEDVESAYAVIDSLENDDNETLLFEAMEKTADLADGYPDIHRKIVMVFSDGEDVAVGKTTQNEMQGKLGMRNMPVYAFGIQSAKTEYLNSFGEMARVLGGTLTIFTPQDLEERMQEFRDTVDDTYILRCTAQTNRIDNRMHILTVTGWNQGIKRNREVMLNRSMEDTEAPEIIFAEKYSDREFRIRFSEPVENADKAENYIIRCEDRILSAVYAKYDEEKREASIGVTEELYAGEYIIETQGIRDKSMEENTVGKSFRVAFDGNAYPVEKPETEEEIIERPVEEPAWKRLLSLYGWIIPLLAVLILLAALMVVYRKIKKSKGVVVNHGKLVLADRVEEKQHFHVEEEKGFPVTLEILNVSGTLPGKIETRINGSIIVGRAGFCDVSFDSGTLSKQHFALEYDNSKLYITDLETTNGTLLNGVKLTRRHTVNPDDIIEAGGLKIRIRFRG